MKKPTTKELAAIILEHKRWLADETGSSRANLSRADLIRANLSGAYLSGANLSRANLSGANLSGANLSGANLSRANLSGANLIRANLGGAYLSGANLSQADLSGANLSGANLIQASLDQKYLPVLQITGSMHPITMMGSENIRIGCKVRTLQWWQENNVRLGKENAYSDQQIEEYAKYIELLAWRVQQHKSMETQTK